MGWRRWLWRVCAKTLVSIIVRSGGGVCSRHAEGGCFVLLFPLLDVCSVSTSAATIVVGDYCGRGVCRPQIFLRAIDGFTWQSEEPRLFAYYYWVCRCVRQSFQLCCTSRRYQSSRAMETAADLRTVLYFYVCVRKTVPIAGSCS